MIQIKKFSLAFLLIILLVAAGCSAESKESDVSKETTESSADEEKVAAIEEKDNSAPLIDETNPLDERLMLEEAMNRQKDVLKLSFITDEYRNKRVGIAYYPMDDEFSYGAGYTYPQIISNILFESGTTGLTTNSEFMDTSEGERLNHDSFDGLYGAYEFEGEDTFYITGEDKNGATYIVTAGDSEEGYTNKVMEHMGKSMKTEEEGAYDPFYTIFSLDTDKLKFPRVNKNRSDIYAAVLEAREGNLGSDITITYLTGEEDQITYSIKDKESTWVNDNLYKEVNKEKTDDGHHVIEYFGTSEDDRYFYWTDDVYHYELELTSYNENTIVTKDIYALIQQ